MIEQLENDILKVKINKLGAELSSLVNKSNGLEYLWQASEEVWSRHAPILFPIVGRLKDNKYVVEGKEFELSQHGFARDKEFHVVSKTDTSVIYELMSDENSLKKYPFAFSLIVKYELFESTIKVTYEVENADSKPMPFSIGAHPGFNCPIGANEKYEDYYFEFEKEEDLKKNLLKEGLLSGETENLGTTKSIPLSKDLFKSDALVLKNLKSESIALRSSMSDHRVMMKFVGFPYLGLWTKPGTDRFVCIEPWYGVADAVNADGDIFNKEGIRVLVPGGKFECSYEIKIS